MRIITLIAALAASSGALAATHPFNAHDLNMMDRVGAPVLSPDGDTAAFTVRSTDWDDNSRYATLWTVPVDGGGATRVVGRDIGPGDPHWSGDGDSLYFLAARDGTTQLWHVPLPAGDPQVISELPLDINGYRIGPDGQRVLLSIDVFTDCPADKVLECTRQRLDQRKADPATGMLYDSLFVRHWDHWLDGRLSQLFVAEINKDGSLGELRWLTQGIHANIPPKPWGGQSSYVFSPDDKTVYFSIALSDRDIAWSTNCDVYRVPVDGSAEPENLTAANKAWDAFPLPSNDGKTLYYLAMDEPGFEADRFAIMALDLASGEVREVDPDWDRSAGPLKLSDDGKTLYTVVANQGNAALFAIDIASGEPTLVMGDGSVEGFDVGAGHIVAGHQDFQHPTDLYAIDDGKTHQLTTFNAERLAAIEFAEADWFHFKGWNGDTVHGYVMKPVGYEKGKEYPVAFLIHGGPQGAWSNNFHPRWNPEIYAGQGYAVVGINFHGSVGYGQDFTDAISEHWGDRPLIDLKKGWQAALDKYAFLDGDRACALGASYGGYMVYWIAGVWKEPWQCFVAHDGVFDTRMMYYATEELWFVEHENGGTQWQVPKAYEAFNPLNHVDNWSVPMLVIHSDRDYRIPLSQGLAAFTALQRQGIPSQFLRFPDATHFVSKPHNSAQWLGAITAWLDRWLKPKAE